MKLLVLVFAVLIGLTASLVEFASDTLAAEFPTTGFAYNTLEPNFLQYECYEQGSILECSFTQGRINRKLNPSDVSKKLDEARKQYPNIVEEMKNEDKKFCHGMPTILEAFRLGKAPKEKELAQVFDTVSNLGKEERKVAVELLEVLSRFCLSPTEENWVAVARQSSEKEVRTCNVSVNPYKQKFQNIDGSDKWIVVQQEGPTGACGVLNISRFEKDTESKYAFWNYYSKKVVTNKTGEILPGFSCADLDENEYKFSWQPREIYLGCDFITFGGF